MRGTLRNLQLIYTIYEKNISLLREEKFFTLFENLVGKAVKAAELLVDLKEDHSKLLHINQELNTLDHESCF
jgi:hypothetical protein